MNKKMLLAITAASIAVIGVGLTLFITNSEDSSSSEIQAQSLHAEEVIIEGLPIIPLLDGRLATDATDTSVDTDLPTVAFKRDGTVLSTIENDGKAKVIFFVSHWCPHCQTEMEELSELVMDTIEQTPDVEIHIVSTDEDSTKPNFPPTDWLNNLNFEDDRIHIHYDTLGSEVANFFGYDSKVPYMLITSEENKIIARLIGSPGREGIETTILALQEFVNS